jgi:hypothetical protein
MEKPFYGFFAVVAAIVSAAIMIIMDALRLLVL